VGTVILKHYAAHHNNLGDWDRIVTTLQTDLDSIATSNRTFNGPHTIESYATTFATSPRSLMLQATAFWTDRFEDSRFGEGHALTRIAQVNVPKTRRTYCKGKECKKHTQHKVTR
jgi:hypothetical protein